MDQPKIEATIRKLSAIASLMVESENVDIRGLGEIIYDITDKLNDEK
jgi:hypothetical protein